MVVCYLALDPVRADTVNSTINLHYRNAASSANTLFKMDDRETCGKHTANLHKGILLQNTYALYMTPLHNGIVLY